MQPAALQYKLQEPILLLGKDRFADVDIRIRVKGGGHTSQIYAIRQALSKSLVAYYQKCKWCHVTNTTTQNKLYSRFCKLFS